MGGIGGGAPSWRLWGLPRPSPQPCQPSRMPPSRKAHRELALERSKLPKQLADARLTLHVPWLASGEAVMSMKGEGVHVDSHTCVGPMGHPSTLSFNGPPAHTACREGGALFQDR